ETIDEGKIDELAASIEQEALVQISVVKPHPTVPGRFMLVAGERRWLALQRAGALEYDFMLVEGDLKKSFLLSAVENLHRVDLNPIEQARTFRRFREVEGMSWEEIKRLSGMDVQTIRNKLKLLELPDWIQRMIVENKLPQGGALNFTQYKGETANL